MYDNTTLKDSQSVGQSGAVQLAGNAVFNMYGGTITNYHNWASVAGGVFAEDFSTFHMHGSMISNCSGYQGGAVGVDGSASFIMDDSEIKDCKDKWWGGRIFIYSGSVTISDQVRLYNDYASDAGDDIYNNGDGATLTLAFDTTGLTLNDCNHLIDGWYKEECCRAW